MKAPGLEDLERLARRTLAGMPAELRRPAAGVVVRIAEFPDEDTEREMGLRDPFELLGLYQGCALTEKSVTDAAASGPDMVFLYRRPILDYWCESGESLADIVRHVLVHEIGHHFGFSDADMDRIEREAAGEAGA